jgi:quercetin dioxygenase-like cupin family protein
MTPLSKVGPFIALFVCFALGTFLPLSSAQNATKDFLKITDAEIAWKERPGGVKSAVLFGDPAKEGMYVVRNIFPPGVMSAPHTHDKDRFVTVIRGTWNAGTSANWEYKETVALPAGSFMFHPAGGVHFDGSAKDEVEVQIIGMGPVSTDYLFPKEEHFGKPHKLK